MRYKKPINDHERPKFTGVKPYPKTKEEQDELGEALARWVMKGYPEDIPEDLTEFAVKNGISLSTLRQICNINPDFAERFIFAGEVVASPIWDEWLYQKIGTECAQDFLFCYDKSFNEQHREMETLAHPKTMQSKQIVMVHKVPEP